MVPQYCRTFNDNKYIMYSTYIALHVVCDMWSAIVILMAHGSFSKLPLRIYNGTDAKADEYNYVVRIEIKRYFRIHSNKIGVQNEHLCTASALSSIWVISAAHCIKDLNSLHSGRANSTEKLVIRHGHVEHLPWIHDSFSDVLFTVIHPLYSSSSPISNLKQHINHDICLLKTSPMNMKSYVKLSAVDYKCVYGHEAIVAGFGITTKILPDGKVKTDNTLLLKKPLQVLKVLITRCNLDQSAPPALCLAPRCDEVTSVCGGDSGGPLIHPSGIIGIVSACEATGYCLYSASQERVDTAGIIVPTSRYIEWVYSYVTASLNTLV